MFDGPLMLQVNLPVIDTRHQDRNMFDMGVNIKDTGESELNDSSDNYLVSDTTVQNVILFMLHFHVVVLSSNNTFIPCHPIRTVFQPGFIFYVVLMLFV